MKNYNIAVKENSDEIIFLRKIVEGGTDKSYGIQVARLAGLPKQVIERSKSIMNRLEMDDEIAERVHKDLPKKDKDKDVQKKYVREDDIKKDDMRKEDIKKSEEKEIKEKEPKQLRLFEL